MEILKKNAIIAAIAIIATTAFTSCKKEDVIKPASVATHQRVVMDSGGEQPPQPPPHP